MLFNSWSFAAFLLIVFVGYYFGPAFLSGTVTGQTGWLIVASFVFYGWHTPWLVILLALSTTINAEAARRIISPTATKSSRRTALCMALVFNLAALAFFKYASLFSRLLLPHNLWIAWGPFLSSIPLPIGISFYTFAGISLIVDLWRSGVSGIPGLAPPQTPREAVWFQQRTWFFKAFFPQLVCGPIVKAHQFYHQIERKSLANVDWNGVVKNLAAGFFLKMVVADNLKEATALLRYPTFTELPRSTLLLLLYGFSVQIFADFSGYSLIAIGLGKLFGYELPINFRYPYISRSLTEFWHRWHISLSTWLRDYLYIPLGGNRHGRFRSYFNLFFVMFLGGLWHGAAWSFALWGTAHGLLLAIERVFGVRVKDQDLDRPWSAFDFVRLFLTFNAVSVLWLLFKLPRFQDVVEYVRCLVHNSRGFVPQLVYVIALFSAPVIIMHVRAASSKWLARVPARLGASTVAWVEALAYAAMICLIVTNSGSPGEFIYFQF